MLNEQVVGMLRNNAGDPDIVKRIAEENQLSPAEIAQALKIPEESAARYMPAQGGSAAMADAAGAANAAPPAAGMAATLANPPGMTSPPPATGSAPAVAPVAASPMGQMADAMQKPMAVEPPPQAMQKPAKLPAEMKPQGMGEAVGLREPMGRRPGGNPSLPRLPAFGRGRSSTATEGESAFVDAFNRLRGNIQ